MRMDVVVASTNRHGIPECRKKGMIVSLFIQAVFNVCQIATCSEVGL
jgi:hypothetical protein